MTTRSLITSGGSHGQDSLAQHRPTARLAGGRISFDQVHFKNAWFDELVPKLYNGKALLDLTKKARDSSRQDFDFLNHFDLLMELEEITLASDDTHAIVAYLISAGEPGESSGAMGWRRTWREYFNATLSLVLPPSLDEPCLDPRMRPTCHEPYLAAEMRVLEFEVFAKYCSQLKGKNESLRAVGERLVPLLCEWRERGIYFFSYSAAPNSEVVAPR